MTSYVEPTLMMLQLTWSTVIFLQQKKQPSLEHVDGFWWRRLPSVSIPARNSTLGIQHPDGDVIWRRRDPVNRWKFFSLSLKFTKSAKSESILLNYFHFLFIINCFKGWWPWFRNRVFVKTETWNPGERRIQRRRQNSRKCTWSLLEPLIRSRGSNVFSFYLQNRMSFCYKICSLVLEKSVVNNLHF